MTRHLRSISLFFPVLALLAAPLHADVPLTWADCVRMAAAHNPQLRSALLAQEASRARYKGSYNGILPQLDLTHSFSRNSNTRSALLTDGTSTLVTNQSTTWQVQGSASLDVFDVNQWATIRTASAAFRQAQANSIAASSTLLSNLYISFSSLMYAQEAIGVSTRIRDILNTNARMISLKYDSGAESKGNNMQTQAQFLQADLNLVNAQRSLRVAQQQLAQTLGIDRYAVLLVTGTWAVESPSAEPPNFDPYIDTLPAVQVQKAIVEQAKSAILSAKSQWFPTLSLNYSRGVEGPTELPSNPYWSFSGLLSYPLLSGGLTSTYYNVTAANRNYEKAQQDLRSTREQARFALESDWAALKQAQDQVTIQQAFLNADVQRKQESDITYQSGLLSYQDWQQITTDFVNVQHSFLAAEQNLLAAEGQWRFATGQSLGE